MDKTVGLQKVHGARSGEREGLVAGGWGVGVVRTAQCELIERVCFSGSTRGARPQRADQRTLEDRGHIFSMSSAVM